jgi:hypothetical protein
VSWGDEKCEGGSGACASCRARSVSSPVVGRRRVTNGADAAAKTYKLCVRAVRIASFEGFEGEWVE